MNIDQVLATTRMVRNTVMTVECLEGVANDVTNGERKPPIIPQHDKLSPPIGQAVSGRVVPIEDGHHALVVDYDIFPAPTEIELPDGSVGYQQSSEGHAFPFVSAETDCPSEFSVATDPVNMGGIESVQSFFEALSNDSGCEFDTHPLERRSQLPDPEVVFTLGLQVSAAWFGARMAKAAADALEPELKNFFTVMISAIKRTALELVPKHRPVTYVLKVQGTPNIEFIARTRDADLAVRAFSKSDISTVTPTVETLASQFAAEFVQFLLGADGTWRLNYALTSNGKVIGTKAAFDHRAVVINEMEEIRARAEVAAETDA